MLGAKDRAWRRILRRIELAPDPPLALGRVELHTRRDYVWLWRLNVLYHGVDDAPHAGYALVDGEFPAHSFLGALADSRRRIGFQRQPNHVIGHSVDVAFIHQVPC